MKWNQYILSILMLTSCMSQQKTSESHMTSIQIIDKNGFKETITSMDRLKIYEGADFLSSQPYDKVVRMYARGNNGKTLSRITTYHENGEPWQYLEVLNGRASGIYREWHDNGILRLDVVVIEGIGDLSEDAQKGWIFDGLSRAWDEKGHLLAEIHYDKGKLQGNSHYFYPSGQISKLVPYENGLIDGELLYYNEKGQVVGKTPYQKGKREGMSTYKGDERQPCYSEEYHNDLLMKATYHDFSGKISYQIIKGEGKQPVYVNGMLQTVRAYKEGIPEGEVQVFDKYGQLTTLYHTRSGMKDGPEWVYYSSLEEREPTPKLYIEWQDDVIQGICRTWYPNGRLESERELLNNQKHGISSAWYLDGSLMLIEEYENDVLQKGSYLKKGETKPVSTVENGEGTATFFCKDGRFLRRALYHKGQVIDGL
jgi:antitoxin component YwqK of YwqJK toxin-antitoxin module